MKKRYKLLGVLFILVLGLFGFFFISILKLQDKNISTDDVLVTKLAPKAVSYTFIGLIQGYYFTETGAVVLAAPSAAYLHLPGYLKDFDKYIALLDSEEQNRLRKLTFGAPSIITKVELLTPEELEKELSHREFKK